MNLSKKLISTLVAGVTLGLAAPVFAEPGHYDRGYDHRDHRDRYSHYDRRDFRAYQHRDFRGYDHRRVVVERPYIVQRPYIVEQPVYYGAPAPNYGIGAMIGAAIGGIIDNR